MPHISLTEAQKMGEDILQAHKVGQRNARLTIASLLRAEMEGLPSHGFSRIPYYASQAAAGKVDGYAAPVVERTKPGVVLVDACCGFAFSAFADGLSVVAQAARESGVALMAVLNAARAGKVDN